MSVDYYCAVGSCIIEDGTGTTAYKLTSAALPEPDPDGYGGHLPAVRSFGIRVEGATKAAVKASVAALRRECVRDETLYWRQDSTGDIISCRIREASVVEEYHDPIAWAQSTPYVTLTLTLTTDPYWLSPWSADADGTIAAVPGHFDVTDVPGETDALVRMRVVMADAGAGMAIGVKPEPASGYDYVDDYGASGAGTSDSNAFGGYKLDSSGLDSSLTAHWTAPNIDTNANRGRHLVIARMDSDATTPANTSAAVQSVVAGNAISVSAYSPATADLGRYAVPFISNNLVGRELGDVEIPAGSIPDMTSSIAWTTEASAIEQTTDSGTRTLTSEVGPGGNHWLVIKQTITVSTFSGRLTAFEYTIDSEPDGFSGTKSFYVTKNGSTATSVTSPPVTSGTHKLTFPEPFLVEPTDELVVVLELYRPTVFSMGVAYGSGAFSDGAFTTYIGSGESAGDDLLFKMYGQQLTGFVTTNPVHAACSESSKTIGLDYVQRVPVDYAAIVYRLSDYSAAPAIFYDGDTDTPYIADADGIGPSALASTEIRKPLRFRPGVTNRVVLGNLQADEALGGATVTYAYRARWLTATGA